MKQSKLFIPTTKEVPADAEALSHQMMLRAGYIKQISAGAYAYLPLAWKVVQNIQNIIREEMEKIDAVEMIVPAIIPADLWKESGRYDTYGDTLFTLNDRHDREFIMGPTHEETMTYIVKDVLNSYKKLPITLYQMQDKFRDENRPRYGLLRGREFLMQDAYAFTSNQEQLDESFNDMEQAYRNIFDRVGLDYRVILGDAGAMGGSDSKEFSAPAEIGEDTIVYSKNSEYAANIEMAASQFTNNEKEDAKDLQEVNTPDAKSIAEVSKYLGVSETNIIKSMAFMADDEPIMVLIRGDYDVNDVKLKNHLNADNLREATEQEITDQFNSTPGFIGPVGTDVKVIADLTVENLNNAVVGANKTDIHFINANLDRDIKVSEFSDFRTVKQGEEAIDGSGKLEFTKGIEIGHIFKLGTKYSNSLGANYLDENGRQQPVIMGSYGIGISRLLSAICEQQADENGLIWNKQITPYDVHVIPVNTKNDEQVQLANEITSELENMHLSVLVDDRKERAGVKFAESDLIGLPIRVTAGKRASEGIVEIKVRKTGEAYEVSKDEAPKKVQELLNEM
ncbi:proline--tRNA ligase [Companilactobacillus sp. RD055328]|uniref:proline--tRNA ligase n=1 Tax=Companilactobacillus sp. RD055328 TaxID=2916634 RepID=UPI001FC811DC|nr:proline--tRNA ligase [Companilactobacillus sp. RD055328]GKQ42609.1 proline--tRNA ligase [Companilactobacillus sp. RD055328]